MHQEEVTTTTATRPKSSLGLEMLGKHGKNHSIHWFIMFIIIFPVIFFQFPAGRRTHVAGGSKWLTRRTWMQNHTPFVSKLDGAVPPNWNVSQHFIAENTISTCSSMLVLLSVFLSCIQHLQKSKTTTQLETWVNLTTPNWSFPTSWGLPSVHPGWWASGGRI